MSICLFDPLLFIHIILNKMRDVTAVVTTETSNKFSNLFIDSSFSMFHDLKTNSLVKGRGLMEGYLFSVFRAY